MTLREMIETATPGEIALEYNLSWPSVRILISVAEARPPHEIPESVWQYFLRLLKRAEEAKALGDRKAHWRTSKKIAAYRKKMLTKQYEPEAARVLARVLDFSNQRV